MDRAATRTKLIKHLQGKLDDGEIKAMESRLLMDLLKEEEAEADLGPKPGGTPVLDLPFQVTD